MQSGKVETSGGILLPLQSILERIDLARVFRTSQPLEVELGSGDGSFITEYAVRHPDRNFIGLERLLGRVRKVERKAKRACLTNLRAVRIESSYFLEYLLPRRSAEALHIYFPDPWPKRRHERHRLVNKDFPGLARRALAPGGTVYLRTDDEAYFEQIRTVFGEDAHFEEVGTPGELLGVITDFEREFRARGIAPRHAAYRVVD